MEKKKVDWNNWKDSGFKYCNVCGEPLIDTNKKTCTLCRLNHKDMIRRSLHQ